MTEAVIHVHRGGPLVALVGNPNCGKTALFNLLTGSRQKVANYAGATVERKEGRLLAGNGRAMRVLDLPGAYSLHPRSPDERITCDVLTGRALGERRPDLVVCVVDATNLRRNLKLVLAVQRQGLPVVVALNMADRALSAGLRIDAAALATELGAPVVATVGVRSGGDEALRLLIEDRAQWPAALPASDDTHTDAERVQAILQRLGLDALVPHVASDRIDALVLHPLAGPALLAVLLFLVFQAVFSWAVAPMDAIKAATDSLGGGVTMVMAQWGAWPWLSSLLVHGVIAGAGGVLVFLPQILILFFFILLLEESGYLPRAAFLLDRLMGGVGLSGRSFIPLLSSFACAVPGIMAARTIANPRDRLVTIVIAPLMTCSARLPVYALLIGAFVPVRDVGGLSLQGLVLFSLYGAGIMGAMGVAWVLKRLTSAGSGAHADDGTAHLPLAHAAPRGAGPVAARAHLPAPRGRRDPDDDGGAVVPGQLSGAAGRRHRRGYRIQPGRHAGPRPGGDLRADRLQLADQRGAGAGHGRARGRGLVAGHRLRAGR